MPKYPLYIHGGAFLSDVSYRTLLCITKRGIEMSDKKTKVDCQLSIYGTAKADAKATQDMDIPDPEPSIGRQIIKDAIQDEVKDSEDGDQQENS